jgi:hypothetical protein
MIQLCLCLCIMHGSNNRVIQMADVGALLQDAMKSGTANTAPQAPQLSPEQISSAILKDKSAAALKGAKKAAVKAEKWSPLTAFKQGVGDMVNGSAQFMAHALPQPVQEGWTNAMRVVDNTPYIGGAAKALGFTPATPSQVDQYIQNQNASYEAGRQAAGKTGVDWPRLGGNLVGSAPLALLAPEAGGGVLGAMAKGAASGIMGGAATPVTNGNYGQEKAQQLMGGALVGGALPGAGRLASRVIKPVISDAAKALTDRGVTLTPGQMIGGAAKRYEDKMTSLPILGDLVTNGQRRSVQSFNKAILNDVVDPIGGKVNAIGHEGVSHVSDQLSNAYDNLLPQIHFHADQPFISAVSKIKEMSTTLPKARRNQLNHIIDTQLGKLTSSGNASGETIKNVMSDLGREASSYGKDPSVDARKIGEALREVNSQIRQGLTRVNPDHAQQLQAIDHAYSKYAIVRDAASRVGSKDGIFTPAQFRAAVRNADKSVKKGNFARGRAKYQDLARSANEVIGGNYPNSGTPGRILADAGVLGLLSGHTPEILASMAAHPAGPIIGGMAAIPYLSPRIGNALLLKRPGFAVPLANAVENTANRIAPLSAPLMNGLMSNPSR